MMLNSQKAVSSWDPGNLAGINDIIEFIQSYCHDWVGLGLCDFVYADLNSLFLLVNISNYAVYLTFMLCKYA